MRIVLILFTVMLTNCSWFSSQSVTESGKSGSVDAISNKESVSKTTTQDNCSKAFEETIGNLNSGKSFKPLFAFYKNHSNCMDAGYSEGIEGAISEQLDVKWSKLNELDELFVGDPGFKLFIFQNIGCYVSGTEKNLEAVIQKTKMSCPKNLNLLCSEIKIAAEKAITYSQAQ